MKSTIGEMISITIFGESHGKMIGAVIDGICPGVAIDYKEIQHQLDLRKPRGRISTARVESDEPLFVSGVVDGHATGTPICILFENNNTKSKDYASIKDFMRPSHADYTAQMKYLGYQDYRGGGHFSGRLTTAIVAAGAICNSILKKKGITIATHIKRIQQIEDSSFNTEEMALQQQLNQLNEQYFPVLDEKQGEKMKSYMEQCANEGDSCGGILESVILGMPAGIGEPMFHSIESVFSHLLFSVPALKGVAFGLGFDFANYKGSEVNDSFYYDSNGNVKTKTNNNAGINGGISNGMPIVIKTVIKPTPSIYKEQETINIKTKENVKYQIQGRHDPAIIHRARVVVDSMIAIGLLDLLTQRFGYLWMGEE